MLSNCRTSSLKSNDLCLVQIRSLHTHIEQHKRRAQCMDLEAATVTRVEPVGMGDRVCVDLCANMCPGEGMLVGNFCRSLFLVHSEVRFPRLLHRLLPSISCLLLVFTCCSQMSLYTCVHHTSLLCGVLTCTPQRGRKLSLAEPEMLFRLKW